MSAETALELTRQRIRIFAPDSIVCEFRGEVPSVPTADGVDMEALLEGDANPMFVTLQVAGAGLVSANGVEYDDYLVGEIEAQIKEKRPDALMGHIPDVMRDSAFPATEDAQTPFAGIWVGALRVGNVLWGKAYIPPGRIREYFARKKATGGKVGTSIYGLAVFEEARKGVYRLRDFVLETLDFAPADRASLKMGGEFVITSETGKDNDKERIMPPEIITPADVPASVREQIAKEAIEQANLKGKASQVAELESTVAELRTTVAEEAKLRKELETEVAELRRYAEVVGEVRATLGSENDANVVEVVRQMHTMLNNMANTLGTDYTNIEVRVYEMHENIAEMERDAFDREVADAVAEATAWKVQTAEGEQKLAALRNMLTKATIAHMGDQRDRAKITESVTAAYTDMQPIAEAIRDSLSGGSALVSEQQSPTGTPDFRSPEYRKSLKQNWKVS